MQEHVRNRDEVSDASNSDDSAQILAPYDEFTGVFDMLQVSNDTSV